jgi:magnesium transporter
MNFVGIPELEWKYSYPVFWLLVLVISGMSFYFMKKRKWV